VCEEREDGGRWRRKKMEGGGGRWLSAFDIGNVDSEASQRGLLIFPTAR